MNDTSNNLKKLKLNFIIVVLLSNQISKEEIFTKAYDEVQRLKKILKKIKFTSSKGSLRTTWNQKILKTGQGSKGMVLPVLTLLEVDHERVNDNELSLEIFLEELKGKLDDLDDFFVPDRDELLVALNKHNKDARYLSDDEALMLRRAIETVFEGSDNKYQKEFDSIKDQMDKLEKNIGEKITAQYDQFLSSLRTLITALPYQSESTQIRNIKIINSSLQTLKIGYRSDFLGREEAKSKILAYLFDDCLNAFALVGTGGIGKTFLVHDFFQQYKNEFDVIEIFFGSTRSFMDIGLDFLSRFEVRTDHISTENELIAEIDTVFKERKGRTLILDDICSLDQKPIQFISKQRNWKVIITTRNTSIARELTHESLLYQISPFSNQEALELYQAVLGNRFSFEQIDDYIELASKLGGRPYGIRLSAENLKLVGESPKNVLKRLEEHSLPHSKTDNHHYDLRDLRPLLEECLYQVEKSCPIGVLILKYLAACSEEGINGNHFKEWITTSIDTDEYFEGLKTVLDFNLLIEKEVTYSFFGQETKETFFRLHTDLYCLLNERNLDKELEFLDLFLQNKFLHEKEELSSYVSLHKQILNLINKYETVDKLELLYSNFIQFLDETDHRRWIYDLGNGLISFWEKMNIKNQLPFYYANQALILFDWEKYDVAMELFEKSISLSKEIKNIKTLPQCYIKQAIIYKKFGKYIEALTLLEKSEHVAKIENNLSTLATSYLKQAEIYHEKKDLTKAMKLLKKAEKTSDKIKSKILLSDCYLEQAEILKDWGELDQANKLLRKVETTCVDSSYNRILVRCYMVQALILYERKEYENTMELLTKAEKIYKKLVYRIDLAICFQTQANALKVQGHLYLAMEALNKSEKIYNDFHDEEGLVYCQKLREIILKDWKRFEQALTKLEKTESVLKLIGDKKGLSIVYKEKARMLRDIGKIDDANELDKKVQKLKQELQELKL